MKLNIRKKNYHGTIKRMRQKCDRIALALLVSFLIAVYFIYKPSADRTESDKVALVSANRTESNKVEPASANRIESDNVAPASTLSTSRAHVADELHSQKPQATTASASEHNAKNCGSLTISVMRNMGIGNMLFQYAAVYGLSRKLNRKATIHTDPTMFRPKKIFSNITIPIIQQLPPHIMRVGENGKCCVASPKLLSVPCDSADVELCCYTQSWKYFESYMDDLRQELKFKDELEKPCQSALEEEIRRTGVNDDKLWLVGVHFRNYASEGNNAVKHGHPMPNMTFIHRAMEEFRKKSKAAGKVPRFLLVGRELDWLKTKFSNSTEYQDVLIAPKRSWEVDFCLLTKVDHVIITTGTFAWWAAFLNKGIVMRQPDHCVAGSQFCAEFNKDGSDHYLNDKWLYFW